MTPITIEHSESLYFPTGDIVLLSLPKDGFVTAFKVDRVFLIRSSPVFEGMFALPPSGDVESYDNVPLVKLQDEPDHLTMFLKALYDSRCIPWQKHDPNTINMVEGTLLLATKYQIDHLRERIISLLEQDWPSQLTQWDINEVEIKAKKDSVECPWEISTPDPCEAIRLARRCDVPSILPAAFYCLSRLRGISDRRVPESLRNLVYDIDDDDLPERAANFSLLSAQDFYHLIVGRDATLRFFERLLDDIFTELTTHKNRALEHSDKCWKSLEKVLSQVRREVYQDFDDLLSVMKEGGGYPLVACWYCQTVFHDSLKTKREEVWENLPSLFMLDTKQ